MFKDQEELYTDSYINSKVQSVVKNMNNEDITLANTEYFLNIYIYIWYFVFFFFLIISIKPSVI